VEDDESSIDRSANCDRGWDRPGACFQPWAGQELTTAGFPDIAVINAPLTPRNKIGTMFFLCSMARRRVMLKIFVEEAAALASITLFVGMIAVWAQLIPQF
jgi:hypothetical protein